MSDTTPNKLERVQFASGTQIFQEGEPGSCAYLIENGEIEISAVEHGRRIVIATLGAGELFGEIALIDNLKRSATATVVKDADLIMLDRSQFKAKISAADPVLHMLLRVVLKRFRWALRRALSQERMNMSGEMPQHSGQTMMFDAARNAAIQQIRMEQDLREGLRDGQFELHYQPVVETDSLRIAGFEALIRWNHPERGMIPPAEFISAAEDSKLIVPMGEWIIKQACADLVKLQAEQAPGDPRFFMAINVSSRQIQYLAEGDNLAGAIRVAGLDPSDLKLEFTESVLIESPERASKALGDIKKVGVNFAIDDFGTGYSSLSYLQRFPLDVLKIDQSFVADMVKDEDSLQIVRAIMGLSKGLSMEVVAEGIENREALKLLRELGCDYVQGFLLSRPVPIRDALILAAIGINLPEYDVDVPREAAG